MTISFIIPCYNEEGNIALIFKCITETFKRQNYDLQLIFIDDGSSDGTLAELKKLMTKNDCTVDAVIFSRNFGKEAAIYAGLEHAAGDYVCIIDADLQQPPEIVLEMAQILDSQEDFDCVTAFQKKRSENLLIKFMKYSFYKIINSVSYTEFVANASDFRLFRRNMAETILRLSEKNRFSKGIFSWIGFKTKYIPYIAKERNSGSSKWSFGKLIRYSADGIFSFSHVSVLVTKLMCRLMLTGNFVYFLVLLIHCLKQRSAPSQLSVLIFTIFLVGGLVMLSLTLLNEYIARMFIEIKDRPIYIAKTVINNKKKE